ncbi:hypothetical protein LTR41_010943 [Exophiala xenobiotica]|nr:hypothetical protein LTR41_010943 [Exophiala xenobiotica]KAK5551111.1 hypothetical protein LTR46_010864 [Exophiala xenobiotica]
MVAGSIARVQDHAKYRRLYNHEFAMSIVRFELAHYDAIRSAVEELGPELLDRSEIRNVDTVATAFSFSDLKGVWKIAEADEVVLKYGVTNTKGALVGKAGAVWPYRIITGFYEALLTKNVDD